MRIVLAILDGVADGRIMDTHIVIPTPLRDLIRNYNKIALNDAKLPAVTEETTGAELKKAISMLEPADQVAVLNSYCQALRTADQPEKSSVGEDRRLRQLIRRIFMMSLGTLLLVLVGSALTVASLLGVFKNFWTNQLVMTAVEFVKFLFSTPTK